MRSDVRSTRDIVLLCTPEKSDVVCLQDQDNDPVYARQNRIDAEAGRVMVVLAPYCMALMVLLAISRLLERVDGSENDEQKPGDDCQDLVSK